MAHPIGADGTAVQCDTDGSLMAGAGTADTEWDITTGDASSEMPFLVARLRIRRETYDNVRVNKESLCVSG